jgi:hypothetical protein
MEGWGYKKRLTGLTHPWQKRYFRLSEGETDLFYFKSPSAPDGTERGSIDLLGLSRICPTDDSVKNPRDPAVKRFGEHSLDVHTTEPRVYHLIFESALDKEAWARAMWRAADPALCKVHPSLQGVCGIASSSAAKSGGGGTGAGGALGSPSLRAAAAVPATSPAAKPVQSPNNPFNALSLDGGSDGFSGGGGGGGGGAAAASAAAAAAAAEEAAEGGSGGGGGGGFLNLFSRKEKEATPEVVELQPWTGSREASLAAQRGGGRGGRSGVRGGGLPPGRGRGRGGGGGGGGGPRGRGGGAQRGRRGRGGGSAVGGKAQPLLDSEDEGGSSDEDDSDSEYDTEDSGSDGGEGKSSCCVVA